MFSSAKLFSRFTQQLRSYHSHFDKSYLRRELNALHKINNQHGNIYYNLPYETTKEHMKAYGETTVLSNGVHTINTHPYYGRSPSDKYVVFSEGSESSKLVDFGKVNQKVKPEIFSELYDEVVEHLSKKERL